MTICDDHMRLWNVTKEEFFAAACENVKRLIPAQLFTMSRVVEEIFDPALKKLENRAENLFEKPEAKEEDIMYVLSNSLRSLGAACIAYPHVLAMAGEILREDFYVLPSSIHEGATRFAA